MDERLLHRRGGRQSGNPGGRPKVSAEIRDLARDHGRKAIERLAALMNTQNESIAFVPQRHPWIEGYGGPMQGIELNE